MFWIGAALSAFILGAGGGYLVLSGQLGDLGLSGRADAEERSPIGAYLSAHAALSRNDDVAAARFLREALESDPENRLLLNRAFATSVAAGDMEQAIPLARRVIEAEDGQGLAHLVLLAQAVKDGDYAAAREQMGPVEATMDGPNFLAALLDAWIAEGEGNTDAAIEAMARLDPVAQIRPYADLHRALIYAHAGREDAAAEFMERAAQGDQRLPFRSAQHIIAFYAERGERDKALEILNRYRASNQDSEAADYVLRRLEAGQSLRHPVRDPSAGIAEAFYALSSLMRGRNASQESQMQAQLARYLRPDDPAGLALLANILEARDQTDRAIELYMMVDRESPYGWEARLSAARLHAVAERYDRSAELFRDMADEQEDRWDALYYLGGVRRSQEEYGAAIEAYEEAAARIERGGGVQGRHWQLFFALGIAHHQADQWPQAEAAFLRALELLPNQPEVLNYLAYSWVERRENLPRALEMLETAVAARPRSGAITDSVGWAYYQLGDYDKAIRYLERAVSLEPGEPEINDHLGDAYWRVGRRAEARFQWRRALSLNPPEAWISRIQAKLENGLPPPEAENGSEDGQPENQDGDGSGDETPGQQNQENRE